MLEVELTIGDQEHIHKACQHYRLNPVRKQGRNKKQEDGAMERKKKTEGTLIQKAKMQAMNKTGTEGPKTLTSFNI